MTRRGMLHPVFSALNACLLSLAVAAFARAESRYEPIDALLARLADSHEIASPERRGLERKCLADFSIDSIAREKTPPLIYGTKSPIAGLVDGIRRYYECEAFTQGKPDLCKALVRYQNWEVYGDTIKTTNRSDDLEAYCRSINNNFIVIRLNVAGRPDAAKACEALPFTREELGDKSLPDECEWMTTKTPDPGCRSPISPALGRQEIEDCVAHGVLHADEGACPLIDDAPLTEGARAIYRARCKDAAAYRRAFRAKDASRCGGSLVCRTLMGEKVCSRHLDRFRGEFCRSWTQRKLREILFIELEKLLAGFEPKWDPGYVTRREAYRELVAKKQR